MTAQEIEEEDERRNSGAPVAVIARVPTPSAAAAPAASVPNLPLPALSGSGKMSPAEMRTIAWFWLQKTASPQTRVALARALEEPSLPPELRTAWQQFLLQPLAANAEAQAILVRGPGLAGETRAALGLQLTRFSSEALGAILGIPAEVAMPPLPVRSLAAPVAGRGRGGSDDDEEEDGRPVAPPPSLPSALPAMRQAAAHAPIDAATGYRLAEAIWNQEQVTALEEQLAKAASLPTAVPQIAFSATIPTDATRTALHQLLKRYSEEGPAALEASGLFKELVFEPGFVAVVKLMPRKDRPATPRGGSARTATRTLKGPNGTALQEAQAKDQLAQDWMRISEGAVRALCARLKAAGRSQSPEGFPLELPPNARVTSCVRWEWPTEEAKQWSGVPLDPMKVYYASMELHGRANTTLGFFKHRMNNPTIHELDKDIWAETFRALPNPSRRQSYDVIITLPPKAESSPVPGPQPEVDLTIEVLSIEVHDPAPAESPAEPKR